MRADQTAPEPPPSKARSRRPRPTFEDGSLTRVFKFPSKTYPKSSYYVTGSEIIVRIRKARRRWKLTIPKKRVVSYRTNRWFAKPRWVEIELTYTQATRLGLLVPFAARASGVDPAGETQEVEPVGDDSAFVATPENGPDAADETAPDAGDDAETEGPPPGDAVSDSGAQAADALPDAAAAQVVDMARAAVADAVDQPLLTRDGAVDCGAVSAAHVVAEAAATSAMLALAPAPAPSPVPATLTVGAPRDAPVIVAMPSVGPDASADRAETRTTGALPDAPTLTETVSPTTPCAMHPTSRPEAVPTQAPRTSHALNAALLTALTLISAGATGYWHMPGGLAGRTAVETAVITPAPVSAPPTAMLPAMPIETGSIDRAIERPAIGRPDEDEPPTPAPGRAPELETSRSPTVAGPADAPALEAEAVAPILTPSMPPSPGTASPSDEAREAEAGTLTVRQPEAERVSEPRPLSEPAPMPPLETVQTNEVAPPPATPVATLVAPACRDLDATARALQIHFDYASASLDRAALAALEELARRLPTCPSAALVIEGHSDSDGAPDRNQAVSVRRAQAVREQLVSAGARAERLSVIGFGASRPSVPNVSAENKHRNRRVLLVLELPR